MSQLETLNYPSPKKSNLQVINDDYNDDNYDYPMIDLPVKIEIGLNLTKTNIFSNSMSFSDQSLRQ